MPDDTPSGERPTLSTREPLAIRAAIVALVTMGIDLLISFGVEIDDTQQSLILAFTSALAALVVVLWVRPQVTPVADPRINGGATMRGS